MSKFQISPNLVFPKFKRGHIIPRTEGVKQGGIKFEILWEPNFPINNFAQNSGEKLRHRPDNNKRKVVTNDKTGQKYSFIQRKNVGQSGQIGTMHQKLLIWWNITHMGIWNSLVDPFVVKYERTSLGQACFYIWGRSFMTSATLGAGGGVAQRSWYKIILWMREKIK